MAIYKCKICKREFKDSPSHNRKYCSWKCSGISTVGKPSWNKGKKLSLEHIQKLSLAHTGKKGHHITPHTMATKIKISAAQQGVGAEDWSGFKKSEDKIERAKFRTEIQKKVFERDGYTCQMCGKTNTALQVDHIQPWSEYVEGRFDMENCRTLCEECHYLITFNKPKPKHVVAWGHNLKHKIEGGLS